MRKTIFANAGDLALMAADAGAGSGAAAKTAATAERVAPVISPIDTDVQPPERKTKRGSVSLYPFDQLTAVGASFHVANKTAKQLSTIVSNANRKNLVDKKDAAGNVVYKTKTMKAADGTETVMPTQEAEKVPAKRFYAVDVDKTDPRGKGARVFREV